MAGSDIISSGIGFLGGLLGFGTNDAEEQALKQAQEAADLFKYGNGGLSPYDEPGLNYSPELYSIPENIVAEQITEDPNLKAAQMSALNNMLGLTESGIDAKSLRDFDINRRKVEEESTGQQEAIFNNMAARGLGGSGMEFGLREKANQDAADRLSQAGLALEDQKANTRLNALNNMLTGAGVVRGQDLTVNSRNTDALNRFIEENSRRKWATKNANVDMQNQSQLLNKQDTKNAYINAYNQDMQRRVNNANALNKQSSQNLALGEQNRTNMQNLFASGGKVAGNIYDYATTDDEEDKKKQQGAA